MGNAYVLQLSLWLTRHVCSERKNVNLPGVVVDLPTLTKKDEEDLVNWGIPNDIDFIAASFVRKGQDLDNIRKVSLTISLLSASLNKSAIWSCPN